MNKNESVAARSMIAVVFAIIGMIGGMIITSFRFAAPSYAAEVAEEPATTAPALTEREAECVEAMQRCVGVSESGAIFQIYSPEYIAALTAVVEARDLDLVSTNNSVRYLDGAGKKTEDLVAEMLQILSLSGTGAYEKEVAGNVLANL